MKKLIVIFASLMLASCKPLSKETQKEIEDAIDAPVTIQSVPTNSYFEYDNADGQCDNNEWFGDSPNGCLKRADVIVFYDGSMYYSLNVGPNVTMGWAWSGYLSPSEKTFTETLALGSGISLMIYGEINSEHPTMYITYDSNGDYRDTRPKKIEFKKVGGN